MNIVPRSADGEREEQFQTKECDTCHSVYPETMIRDGGTCTVCYGLHPNQYEEICQWIES